MNENMYWGSRGKYQKEYDKFSEENIPKEGQAHNLKAETLRLASNLYYDFNNNGLCNVFLGGRRLDFQLLRAVLKDNGLMTEQLENLFERIEERDEKSNEPFSKVRDSMPISEQNVLAFEHLINRIMEWILFNTCYDKHNDKVAK